MIRHQITGWINPEEYAALYELALEHQPVLEVGCYAGLSTSALAQAGEVTTIDANPQPNFLTNMMVAGVAQNVTLRVGWSRDILPKLTGPYGMVFIDGGHSYVEAFTDIEWAVKLLADDGVIVVDDITWPDVKRATEELLPGWIKWVGKMGVWHASAG